MTNDHITTPDVADTDHVPHNIIELTVGARALHDALLTVAEISDVLELAVSDTLLTLRASAGLWVETAIDISGATSTERKTAFAFQVEFAAFSLFANADLEGLARISFPLSLDESSKLIIHFDDFTVSWPYELNVSDRRWSQRDASDTPDFAGVTDVQTSTLTTEANNSVARSEYLHISEALLLVSPFADPKSPNPSFGSIVISNGSTTGERPSARRSVTHPGPSTTTLQVEQRYAKLVARVLKLLSRTSVAFEKTELGQIFSSDRLKMFVPMPQHALPLGKSNIAQTSLKVGGQDLSDCIYCIASQQRIGQVDPQIRLTENLTKEKLRLTIPVAGGDAFIEFSYSDKQCYKDSPATSSDAINMAFPVGNIAKLLTPSVEIIRLDFTPISIIANQTVDDYLVTTEVARKKSV